MIGGGLLGLTSAWELKARGQQVMLLERGNELASGASFANGGLLTASMSAPWNGPGVLRQLAESFFRPSSPVKVELRALPSLLGWGLRFLHHSRHDRYIRAASENYRLASYSIAETARLRERLGLRYAAWAGGAMKIFFDSSLMSESAETAARLAELGLRYERLDTKQTLLREPGLTEIAGRLCGSLFFPDDESGDAQHFCRSLASVFEQRGGTIRLNTRVDRILSRRGRVSGIVTNRGILDTRRVVIAAGCGSVALARTQDVTLPIRPVKGYSLTIPGSVPARLPCIPIIDDAKHVAIVPIGKQLRIVGMADFNGHDAKPRRRRVETLKASLRDIYPSVAEHVGDDVSRAWAGLRPMSADGVPLIGPAGPPGLYVNTGHGHLGWTMAVGSAKLLAELMLGARSAIDPTPFRADR